MLIKDKIIDYDLHKNDAERWIGLKGEKKYLEFVKILEDRNVPVKWVLLDDLYRYDKRLLINIFKYLSFYEEFLRALIWNVSQESYNILAEDYLKNIIEEVIKNETKINYKEFNIQNLKQNKTYINYLRNRVSHNKIILTSSIENLSVKEILLAFKDCLPESYKHNFIVDINTCCSGLSIDKKLSIKI